MGICIGVRLYLETELILKQPTLRFLVILASSIVLKERHALDQRGRQGLSRVSAPGTHSKTLQTEPSVIQRHLQNAPLMGTGHVFYQPPLDSRFRVFVQR